MSKTFKYCERCGNEFELGDHYASVILPDERKWNVAFIDPDHRYRGRDWCSKCTDEFLVVLNTFERMNKIDRKKQMPLL